jgi:cytochrome c biogenesis protein
MKIRFCIETGRLRNSAPSHQGRGATPPGEMTVTAKDNGFFTTIWDFLCSLKLTIITLILLAVTSIIGTVIQQNKSPQEYIELYGETTFRLFEALQFFDMYRSWWFVSLLTLFTANLVACSIKRFPRVYKTVKEPVLVADDTHYRTMSNVEEITSGASPEALRDKISAFLGTRFGQPVVTEQDGKIHLFAQKGAYARFGVYVTHLSIVVIFLGAIIGNVFGYKGFVNIVEGTETDQVWLRGKSDPIPLGFSVRCDEFSVSYYENSSRPKEFKSLLTVTDNGQVVKDKRPVIVNDPLTYKGITFYQSSYGPAGDPTFNLRVRMRDSGETANLVARQGQRMQLPGGAGFFRVADFTPSFQNFGPAARIEVFQDMGSQPRSFVVLQAHPEFDAQRGGAEIISLLGYEQRFYTGLQVAKDPGVWTVWVGCTLLVVGSMIAFFLSHRRIWVTIQPLAGKTGIKIGGTAHRNQPAFEIFFDDLKKGLKEELKS